jgi:gliding motility-associated lipoprotein GldH
MKLTKLIAIVVFVSVFLSITSCSSNVVFDENVAVNEAGWDKNDVARFDVVIEDSINAFDYYLNIRHTVDYRFSNLFVFMNTTYPNGNISVDTIEFVLADKSGKWHGKGWGEIKDNSVLLVKGIKFPLKGSYTFQIRHAMRVDTLKEISNIGIRIEKTDN